MKKPPRTGRCCPNCKRKTSWRYDRNIGHSYCNECGASSVILQDSHNITMMKALRSSQGT